MIRSRNRALAMGFALALAIAETIFLSGAAVAQTAEIPFHVESYSIESGSHDGVGLEPTRPFRAEIRIAGAEWLQLLFDAHDLGRGSWISIRSVADGGHQTLDARTILQWGSRSAYFNGDAVELELHVAPDDKGVFVNVVRVIAGEPARVPALAEEEPGFSKDICGGVDDRVASNDNRVCRTRPVACTAWRISNGAFLTAGHCVDRDPDGGGPGLPDGMLDSMTVVEFNVPASQANGTIRNSAPQDQYPVNNTNVQWRFDGAGQGLGKDWAVFAVYPCDTTGLMPHEVYGLPFRMMRELPNPNDATRVTGFGIDSLPPGAGGVFNAQSQTNQTSTGNYVGEVANGADIWVQYAVDAQGGSSGSPVVWETNGVAFGIHTNGGCLGGNNSGTSFEVDALETAIANFPGPNTRYVDAGHPLPVTEDGSPFRPYNTLVEGTDAVPTAGIVSVVAGTYPVGAGRLFDRQMKIEAPVGSILITQ